MGILDEFRRKVADDLEVWVNDSLSPDIRLGSVGTVGYGKKFEEESKIDLDNLGVSFAETGYGPPFDEDYSYSADEEFSFSLKASGEDVPMIPSISTADAGFRVEFGKTASYLIACKQLRYKAIDIDDEFISKVTNLNISGDLRFSSKFVVGVFVAESVSYMISQTSKATVDVKVSADIESIADVSATYQQKQTKGSVLYRKAIQTKDQEIPIFFVLARIRLNGQIKRAAAFMSLASPVYNNRGHIYEIVSPREEALPYGFA